MRLNRDEISIIRKLAKMHFGNNAKVMLFGSRADDKKRGGDIDLLVIPFRKILSEEIFEKKIAMLIDLEVKLGMQNIDLLVEHEEDTREIIKTAKKGIRIV